MRRIAPVIFIIILLIIWEIVARSIDMQFILPTPTGIVNKIWELKDVLLLEHLPATMLVVFIGLMISIVLGILLAILMTVSQMIEQALYPVLVATQTIPIIAIAPVFVLWFGYTIWSRVLVTVLITFFPIVISSFDGIRATSRELTELMHTMGANRRDIFFKLQVPASLPSFFSGLKVAVPMAVIGAAIGEWLGAQEGLGYFSRRMMTQFDGAGVFAPIIVLSLAGLLLFAIVLVLESYILKWRKYE
ncbi:ABC transporter permease [Aciduricibacillus chroicocephali]|uniref:ABC transporter permease n=1 Tax=Aciduricibacillus chroicocephali TaxID=3054939 RepID=A0ABY9KTS0_9BACI|nr:ABC transporter permease [Bacillaceae bacterium 44XB]